MIFDRNKELLNVICVAFMASCTTDGHQSQHPSENGVPLSFADEHKPAVADMLSFSLFLLLAHT